MMRALLAAVLAVAATLGGLRLGTTATGDDPAPAPMASEFVEVPTIAVPVFADGAVTGYVLAGVAFEVEARALHALRVPPRALLTDALHGLLLSDALAVGPDGPDLPALRAALREAIDAELGGGVVRALVLRLDLLAKDEIRSGRLRRVAVGETADG